MPAINSEIFLKVTGVTVFITVISERCPTGFDGLTENVNYLAADLNKFPHRDFIHNCMRINFRAPKNLARVDITYANYNFTVHQKNFYWLTSVA